jgi:hypothetical protein
LLTLQQVAVAKLRVITTTVSSSLVYDAVAGTVRALQAEMVRRRLHSRDRLRRFRGAISSGREIAIIGLGDPITDIQWAPSGEPRDLSQARNGIYCDRATTTPTSYLTPNYDIDYLATVATYTAVSLAARMMARGRCTPESARIGTWSRPLNNAGTSWHDADLRQFRHRRVCVLGVIRERRGPSRG